MTYIVNGRAVSQEEWDAMPSRLEEMLTSQQAPACVTDATFMRGTENGRQFQGGGMTSQIGDYYASVAKKHGVSITGKKYSRALARFPGDPEAWVDSRGDVKRRIESRPGWCVEGAVNHQGATDLPPPASVDVHPKILAREIRKELKRTGPVKDTEAVKEKVKKRLMGRRGK